MRLACAVLVFFAAAPAIARADSIVFRRGTDIWLMAPDGTSQRQVTNDGLRYEWPSAADDGTIVASDTSGTLHRLTPAGADLGTIPTAATTATDEAPAETPTHVRVSPDGTKIAYDEAIDGDVTTLWTPGFPGQALGQEGLIAPSWIGNSRLLLSRDVSAADEGETFALYDLGADDTAADYFSDDASTWATGFDAAASRDGTRLAILEDDAAESDGTPTRVALRLFTGTTFRCELALEAADTYDSASPSFSPDGASVAWAESDGIHVASSGCADERVVTLPGAWEPYWSAASIPTPATAAPRLTLALKTRSHPHRLTVLKRGIGARVTVSAPARVKVTVRVAGTRHYLGSTTRDLDAGTHIVRVRLKDVRKRLVVRVSAPGATPVSKGVRPRSGRVFRVPSRAPGPQVSGSLKPSRERVRGVDDHLVVAGDPGAAGDRGDDGGQVADGGAADDAAGELGVQHRLGDVLVAHRAAGVEDGDAGGGGRAGGGAVEPAGGDDGGVAGVAAGARGGDEDDEGEVREGGLERVRDLDLLVDVRADALAELGQRRVPRDGTIANPSAAASTKAQNAPP